MTLLLTVPPLLVAVILHEVAHGWVAEKLGDSTARDLGRITLNPIVHIDLFMTILLPGMLILSGSPIIFGGAKPVPVNPMRFKNPRSGMAWVAVAGPITNFVLAALCYLIVFLAQFSNLMSFIPGILGSVIYLWAVYGVIINLVLGVFNLIPVPPLDGGRIAVGLLPKPAAIALAKLERWGLLIVVLLLMSGVIDGILGPTIEFALKALQGPTQAL